MDPHEVITPEEKGAIMSELSGLAEGTKHIEEGVADVSKRLGDLSERFDGFEKRMGVRHRKLLRALKANQRIDDEQDKTLSKLTKRDKATIGGIATAVVAIVEVLRPWLESLASAKGL